MKKSDKLGINIVAIVLVMAITAIFSVIVGVYLGHVLGRQESIKSATELRAEAIEKVLSSRGVSHSEVDTVSASGHRVLVTCEVDKESDVESLKKSIMEGIGKAALEEHVSLSIHVKNDAPAADR